MKAGVSACTAPGDTDRFLALEVGAGRLRFLRYVNFLMNPKLVDSFGKSQARGFHVRYMLCLALDRKGRTARRLGEGKRLGRGAVVEVVGGV